MPLGLSHLFRSPDHHFLRFDGEASAVFLPLDRAAYHRAPFLDRRVEPLAGAPMVAPLSPLMAEADVRQAPRTGWIFHIAHCGSTLLSRLIDDEAANLVLREPPPLRQLGIAAAQGKCDTGWRGRLKFAHAMAARRFDAAQTTIVKANVPVNFMLDRLIELDREAPAILLHFALEPYLTAILRSPQHRGWIERVTDLLAPALRVATGLEAGAPIAERAAALWLAQMLAFARLQQANPAARSLDALQLFADPAGTAGAVAAHLGAGGVDVAARAAALGGHYAKDLSRPFDERERVQRQQDDGQRLAPELADARRWLERSSAAGELPMAFERPVVGAAPALL